MYEPYINDYQATLEKIIKKYLDTHNVGETFPIYLNAAHTAWITMNGNIMEIHIPGGKWRVVPE